MLAYGEFTVSTAPSHSRRKVASAVLTLPVGQHEEIDGKACVRWPVIFPASNSACPETGLSNPICAARQPSRANRNRAEKLSSRHRRGQAAARLNCQAATPIAIRVSVINKRVDPVSGT